MFVWSRRVWVSLGLDSSFQRASFKAGTWEISTNKLEVRSSSAVPHPSFYQDALQARGAAPLPRPQESLCMVAFLHGTGRQRFQSRTHLQSQTVPFGKGAGVPYSQLDVFQV